MIARSHFPEGEYIVRKDRRYYFSLEYRLETDTGYLDQLLRQIRSGPGGDYGLETDHEPEKEKRPESENGPVRLMSDQRSGSEGLPEGPAVWREIGFKRREREPWNPFDPEINPGGMDDWTGGPPDNRLGGAEGRSDDQERGRLQKQDTREQLLLKFCKAYTGEFLPMLSGEEWVTTESAYYQKWYFHCLKELCGILKENGEFELMLELCTAASQMHPYDEWQAVQIDCLIDGDW